MSDRGCYLRLPEPLEVSFGLIEKVLGEFGYKLARDSTNTTTTWNNGEPKVINSNEVAEQVRSGLITNVQFWQSPMDDMFVSWNMFPELIEFHFAFDGHEVKETCEIVGALCKLLFGRYRGIYHNEQALVVEI